MEQLSIDLGAGLGEQDSPERAGPRLTEEQAQAVRRRDEPILLSAAAGSGKTTVLVERFVQAVCEDGVAPGAVLAITFTDRAAGELRERVRRRLLELGEREAARDTEAAFIGTFHGFCARLLRTHPLPAGLDPDFRILDAGQSARLRTRAYEDALTDFLAGGEPAAVDLLAAYGVDVVRKTIEQLYAELRSRGSRRPRLPVTAPVPGGEQDEADALAAVALFDRLLGAFGDCFERLKRARAAVDFDDLELIAGELLERDATLAASLAESFQLLMVDEFQDTNPRQLRILRALERDNLFTVGDELQSIYGFRHADVRLFGERRSQLAGAGRALALRSNFRSSAEVLDAVNTVFAERFEDFAPLVHAREENRPPDVPRAASVEVLLTSSTDDWKVHPGEAAIAAGLPYAPLSRRAEARLLAQRVRELLDSGEARPGEVVLLLRATGDIETFERALQLQGLRTLASVGTFWGRQQITDLHSYLRALVNPRDEEALYATLASPLVGCSRDGLALVARAAGAGRGNVLQAVAQLCEDGDGLRESDRALLSAFRLWFDGERAEAAARGISQLLERAIARSGYLRHVLALDWAERRLANIHKLLRLARVFEAQDGRDLRGFVDHVEHLKQVGASEPEAPVEDVEPDAVRLMTIHAAKGLEFPVVCVADLGRRPPSPSDRLFVDGRRLGLRLRRPGQGEGIKALEFEQLRDEQKGRERQEEDRVFYVAMTRARERLLLSGTVDFASWPAEGDGTPPINWIGPALCPRLPELGEAGAGVHRLPAEAGAPAVRVTLSDPGGFGTVLRELPSEPPTAAPAGSKPATDSSRSELAGPSGDGTPPRSPSAAPAPAAGPPATLSYTSLTLLERCGYRYYLERVLRMPEVQAPGTPGAAGGLEARARGTLVHRVLETVDFAAPRGPGAEQVGALAAELGLTARTGELEEVAGLVEAALGTELAARIAAAGDVCREHPFAFSVGPDEPLVTGVIDLICQERDGSSLVVDYKSDRIEPEQTPEALVGLDYGIQRLLYALAVLRGGALEVEVVHWFLQRPAEPARARYTLAERPTLEDMLARMLKELWSDPFAVSARPHRGLCLTCPGRSGLCSWPDEMTMREDPDVAGADATGRPGPAG